MGSQACHLNISELPKPLQKLLVDFLNIVSKFKTELFGRLLYEKPLLIKTLKLHWTLLNARV